MQIFGAISDRNWNTIIGHAMECDVNDNELYAYQRPGQDVSLLFNSILKLVGAIFNDRHCSLEELDPSQKVCIRILDCFCVTHLNLIILLPFQRDCFQLIDETYIASKLSLLSRP